MTLKVIFRVYMFGVLSKRLSSIFHQELRTSEFEYHISWISPLSSRLLSPSLLLPPLQSYPLLSPKLLSPPSTTIARHCRFSHHSHLPLSMVSHRRSPLSMVSYRHSPPQPLLHEISLMQMGAVDSWHVSNLKFRYLKSYYAFS